MNDKVLCDVDGVLTPFDLVICKMINPKITEEDLRNLDDWDVFQLFNEEENKIKEKILEDPEFWRNLPVHEHAQKSVEKMRKKDMEIIFLTSPWDSCKEWTDARKHWLKKHFDANTREQVIITHRKELVFGDVLIDDKLENIMKWRKQWSFLQRKAVLFETNTNFKTSWYPRMKVVDGEWRLIEE